MCAVALPANAENDEADESDFPEDEFIDPFGDFEDEDAPDSDDATEDAEAPEEDRADRDTGVSDGDESDDDPDRDTERRGDDAPDDDADPFDEFADLFETDDMFDDFDEEDAEDDIRTEDDPLLTDGVEWSGRFIGSADANWTWIDPYTRGLGEPDSTSLTPSVGADLRFDVRPERDYRVFGSFRIRGGQAGGAFDPVAVSPEALGGVADALDLEPDEVDELIEAFGEGAAADAGDFDISVFELFADFPWEDRLFFRFGKHTINWGVGYFFSPADVLNLTSIDPQDPEADLEGPISLRTLYPFGSHSAYLYLIIPDAAEPLDVAVAPKLILEVAGNELGIGAYYQRDRAPRGILTLRRSIGEVDLFAEGVLSWGSDRTFLREREEGSVPPYETYRVEDALVPSATAGLRWFDDFERLGSVLLAGQYLYNGDGYADIELAHADETLLQIATLVALQQAGIVPAPPGAELVDPDDPTIALADLAPLTTGRHYVGATAGLSEIAGSGFGVSAFGLANLTDFSGLVSPTISYSFLNRMRISAGATFTFGAPGTEFGNPATRFPGEDGGFPDDGPLVTLNLSLSLGAGSF